MSVAQPDDPRSKENETTWIGCCPWRVGNICKCKKKGEEKCLLDNKDDTGYQTMNPDSNKNVPDGVANPIITKRQEQQPPKETKENESKVEEIKMKNLGLAKVDEIFKQFQDTFNAFYDCQTDMQSAVKKFKTAVKTTGEFRVCLDEFKQQLKGQRVVIKKLALKFPKAVQKGDESVKDAATALVSIFKAYNDMEKLPVKVIRKTIDCLKDVMELDMSELAGQEFGGSVIDLGKIPKQITTVRENMKEIRKAPKIVSSFFEYATSIVMDVIEVFGDDKNKEELMQRKETADKNRKKMDDEMKNVQAPEPPKEIKFTSLGIPTIDRIFNDIAKLVNPVIRLSKDAFDARKRLEQAIKAVSEFHDDPSKAFDDYLEELKKRLKKGDVHIKISVNGNRIEIEKVEGFEPKEMQDMESGFKGVIKSGDELIDLAPDSIKELIKLIQDISNISKSDIKNHVALKEVPSKFSALSGNTKKAKTIPGDLKFFLCFVRNLIMDILEVLHTKKEDEAQGSEEGSDNNQTTE